VAWEVKLTSGVQAWYLGLEGRDADRVAVMLDALSRSGPALAAPQCKRIRHSRHHNMKELRSIGGNLRMLFALDPRRRAIVLVGGDKTDDWKAWYERSIPLADRVFDQHLRDLGEEGAWRTGGRSVGRGR
jgi:hypothetical protein